MTTEAQTAVDAPPMSYGCQYGCGNPYHMILISVIDGSTLFLCMPHFVQTATDVISAMTNGLSPEAEAERQAMNAEQVAESADVTARRGKHNAPAGAEDPDLVAHFDGIVYEDELDERFR